MKSYQGLIVCLLLQYSWGLPAHATASTNSKTAVNSKPAATTVGSVGNAGSVGSVAGNASSTGSSIRVLVVAEQESVLAAQMAGRIEQLGVRLGSSIKTGQSLLRFVCEEQDAHLKMAKAEFYGAQQTYEARLKMQAMQSVSELEVQQAASGAEKFKAQIQLYQAQLRLCHIMAPFSGRVTKLHVKPYESVNIGQPLIEIVNDRKLKAQMHVPSNWLTWLKTGAMLSMQIDETGKKYQARVARMNGKVDPVSQSLEIEAEVVGELDGLLPGMSGQASFADALKR